MMFFQIGLFLCHGLEFISYLGSTIRFNSIFGAFSSVGRATDF
jgi:hypothetical protein